jgi:chemosensory pili system protein ChpA (sensor histidine kinase/response regulator)
VNVARVLVVDDEDLVRLVVTKRLEKKGFEVAEARDGWEALALVAQGAPDLVLTDFYMPRCTGEALIRELRNNPATARLPVVLMTGGPTDEALMRELGCAAVLYKPLPDAIDEVLLRVLRGHAASATSAA